MLSLSRKAGERITIGAPGPDQVVVEVHRITGTRVSLRIGAPRDIPIRRAPAAQQPTNRGR